MTNELQIFYLHFLEIVVLVLSRIKHFYLLTMVSGLYILWFSNVQIIHTKIFLLIYLKNRSYVTRLKLIHHVYIRSLEHLQEYFLKSYFLDVLYENLSS